MMSEEHLNQLAEKILTQLQADDGGSSGDTAGKNCIKLTPARLLVLAGILGGVFSVTSVLIDKNQTVQVLLSGTLKRKTDLDKMLDSIGSKSFDEVMGAIVDRFA
ncbi:MAG: hypothetical protein ACOY31_10475 [Bacillota bacterium]